jgi:glycerol-3-phosphate dehydrogenase
MSNHEYDVLVIGGGATGGGTALDLALRGASVCWAERGDLCEGTSGRYHGLLHSGGRYAVSDSESAKECIAENRILRRIVPHAVEDAGGFFVTTPFDDPGYADRWADACRACGIDLEEIPLSVALAEEPALNPAISRAFRVPDGACDSFDMLTAIAERFSDLGGRLLTYHAVTALMRDQRGVTGATLRSVRSGESLNIRALVVVNAAGAWAGQIAAMAGCPVIVRPSKGTMVGMAYRFVNTVINRCHPSGDGDILVPVGTVAVIGTTSVTVDDPNDTSVQPWEVQRMLEEGEKLVPGFSQARALRAWAGVRPLYEEGGSAAGRAAKRTFAVLDHAARDGVPGMVTVVGGKLTTYRLMAERTADLVCRHLGISTPCTTASHVLSDGDRPGRRTRTHWLGHRLDEIENSNRPPSVICECELVTRSEVESAARKHPDRGAPWVFDDLRRDLRLGMGPCQGGFCVYRAAGILHQLGTPAAEATHAMTDFAERRWHGQRPVLWGQSLRQALLDEQIYRSVLGVSQSEGLDI